MYYDFEWGRDRRIDRYLVILDCIFFVFYDWFGYCVLFELDFDVVL